MGWCVSMPFGETFIVINLVAYSERVCLSDCVSPVRARESNASSGTNICLCKLGGLEGKCIPPFACNHPSMQKCVRIRRRKNY